MNADIPIIRILATGTRHEYIVNHPALTKAQAEILAKFEYYYADAYRSTAARARGWELGGVIYDGWLVTVQH